MYIKYITCQVKANHKVLFSEAQEKWTPTLEARGFMGQAGGWDKENEQEACIVSFWEHKKWCDLFMETLHDKIFLGNSQSAHYDSIRVVYYECLAQINGSPNALQHAIESAKCLAIAGFKLNHDLENYFEKVQKEGGFSEMEKAPGWLASQLSKAVDHSDDLLVSSFWDGPEPRNFSFYPNVTESTTRQVLLVNSWKLVKMEY